MSSPALREDLRHPEPLDAHLLLGVSLLRVAYVLVAIALAVGDPKAYEHPHVNQVLVAGSLLWSAGLMWMLWCRPVGIRTACACDLIVALILLAIMGGWVCRADEVLTWGNWAYTLGLATSCQLALTGRRILTATGVLLVAVTYAMSAVLQGVNLASANSVGNLAGLAWFPIIIDVYGAHLRRTAARVNIAVSKQMSAERDAAAAAARLAERTFQQRALHDTVLATLTSLARGTSDPADPELRDRCAREADLIRRMHLTDVTASADVDLVSRLQVVCDDMRALGLRVELGTQASTVQLPASVLDALSAACREALNNVARHAQSSRAWVTVVSVEPTTVVTVVDRGCGFEPSAVPRGFGLTQSIFEAMQNIGGQVRVDSATGEGTVVTLYCPAEGNPRAPLELPTRTGSALSAVWEGAKQSGRTIVAR